VSDQTPRRRIASAILRIAAMRSRYACHRARSKRLTVGRNECTIMANAISAAAEDTSLAGCPATLSTASFAAETPIIVSPTAVGLDRALRTWVPGAAAARRSAPPIAAITNSVTRFDCSLGIPNHRVTTRWRISFSSWSAIITSPTNSLALLMCSGRCGAGGVGGIAALLDRLLRRPDASAKSVRRPAKRRVRLGARANVYRGGMTRSLRPREKTRSRLPKSAAEKAAPPTGGDSKAVRPPDKGFNRSPAATTSRLLPVRGMTGNRLMSTIGRGQVLSVRSPVGFICSYGHAHG